MNTHVDKNAQVQPVRVIGCGAIAREILAVCEANGLDHIDLACLPAQWHLYPDRIAPGVKTAIEEARKGGFERIYVAYADCGTGGMLDKVCEEEGVERIAGPHCYSFYAGNDAFAEWDDDIDAFFLTDFLARQFESFIIEPLGLKKHPELRDMYFGNYRKLIYLSQKDDPELREKAQKAAETLGLEYEYRFTGYGDLTSSLVSA
ncbi:MAG: DUF1638 domain-containing protein [Hyphomicrobiales bacterium]|nr:DUF1638 domain-containing protein [Hyphomicrobiales bacterium]MCP4997386.1 DUF1638 domain-containing protein [Hyphomicrobiales bacterium]